jgi:hypothetical protein
MSSNAKRHVVAASPTAGWLERRMAEFEGHLSKADDVVLGPSGRLLRQSVQMEREASSRLESKLEVVPTSPPKDSKRTRAVQSPLLLEVTDDLR